jgi:hypothetical protein
MPRLAWLALAGAAIIAVSCGGGNVSPSPTPSIQTAPTTVETIPAETVDLEPADAEQAGAYRGAYLVEVSTGRTAKVAEIGTGRSYGWSPDGRIAVGYYGEGAAPNSTSWGPGGGLYLVNPSTLHGTLVSPQVPEILSWSPAKAEAAAIWFDRSGSDVTTAYSVVQADGFGSVRLYASGGYAVEWSPDGRYLLVATADPALGAGSGLDTVTNLLELFDLAAGTRRAVWAETLHGDDRGTPVQWYFLGWTDGSTALALRERGSGDFRTQDSHIELVKIDIAAGSAETIGDPIQERTNGVNRSERAAAFRSRTMGAGRLSRRSTIALQLRVSSMCVRSKRLGISRAIPLPGGHPRRMSWQ